MQTLTARFFALVRQNGRAYGAINVAYYGLVIIAMVWVAGHPAFEQTLRAAVRDRFNPALMNAYAEGLLLPAIWLTFYNNFFLATLLALTLPSLVIPFWGIVIGCARAILWGLALSPADPTYRGSLIAHALTGILEGQAYVLAMLGVYLLWRNTFWPRRAGVATRREGYVLGLRQNGLLYVGVLVLLLVAAAWEAVTAIYLSG